MDYAELSRDITEVFRKHGAIIGDTALALRNIELRDDYNGIFSMAERTLTIEMQVVNEPVRPEPVGPIYDADGAVLPEVLG